MNAPRGRLLVTGARGFIGRRCLPRLAAAGFEVHAASSVLAEGPGARWHRCDLLDAAAGEKLLREVRPSHLLHLAWVAQPGVFWTSPLNQQWLATGTRLIEAFYAGGGRRAVAMGSCAEYADSKSASVEDRTPIAPDSPYGRAKAAMHDALRAAAEGRGTWAWMRLFHPYGPGEPAERFIPSVIDGLLRGTTVACSHGAQVRDFIHVDDVAAACLALVQSEASGAFNVASGRPSSLRDAAAVAVAQLGHGELLRFGQRDAPAGERSYVVADISKMRQQLGWAPQIELREGIRLTIAARAGELKRARA